MRLPHGSPVSIHMRVVTAEAKLIGRNKSSFIIATSIQVHPLYSLRRHFEKYRQEGGTMGVAGLCVRAFLIRDARAHPRISSCRRIERSGLSPPGDRAPEGHDHGSGTTARSRRRLRPPLKVAAATIAGLLAPCSVASQSIAQTLKAPLWGLVSMGSTAQTPAGVPINDLQPILAEPGVFDGVVINIGWDALQPTKTTLDTSTIDTALAAVTAYNTQYPETPLGVRLNVEGALLAPLWAKTMDAPSRDHPGSAECQQGTDHLHDRPVLEHRLPAGMGEPAKPSWPRSMTRTR